MFFVSYINVCYFTADDLMDVDSVCMLKYLSLFLVPKIKAKKKVDESKTKTGHVMCQYPVNRLKLL